MITDPLFLVLAIGAILVTGLTKSGFGGGLGVLAVPLFNRYRQRLGDMMAGTHVIQLPVPVLLLKGNYYQIPAPPETGQRY